MSSRKKADRAARKRSRRGKALGPVALALVIAVTALVLWAIRLEGFPPPARDPTPSAAGEDVSPGPEIVTLDNLPEYSGEPYIILWDNVPGFDEADFTTEPFETYSELDRLGRCGAAYANVCLELMPDEERGPIGMVKPSGWHTVRYDFVDGKYLYNRCHLIGYQLAGENANERNLITGTRYLNIEGMLPFENMVDDYVEETENHVLYRVTPIFEGENLLASGVQMEGWSVEDEGEGICFNVFVYNVQPGVVIDYATGGNHAEEGYAPGP